MASHSAVSLLAGLIRGMAALTVSVHKSGDGMCCHAALLLIGSTPGVIAPDVVVVWLYGYASKTVYNAMQPTAAAGLHACLPVPVASLAATACLPCNLWGLPA